jgi:hypothetical protein
MITNRVAVINGVEIQVSDYEKKLVPIKPICDALGINYSGQYQKIKNDTILSSTMWLEQSVGADGKRREMVCLPLNFVYGWLFSINDQNVDPEIAPTVVKYKMECYEALEKYFTLKHEYHKERSQMIDNYTKRMSVLDEESKSINRLKKQEKKWLIEATSISENQWLNDRMFVQSKLDLDVKDESVNQ